MRHSCKPLAAEASLLLTFSRGLRGKRREQQSRPQGLLEAGLIAISQPPGSPDFTVTVTSWKVIPGQNQVPNWLIILYRLLLTRANQGRALSASQRDQGRDPKEARGGGQTGERMAWRGLQGRAPRGSAQLSRRGRPLHPTHLHSPGFLRRTDFGTTMCAKC